MVPAERADGLDPVHPRHGHVHHDHMRIRVPHHRGDCAAVAGFAHHVDVSLALQDEPQSRPDHRMIVRDDDSRAFCGGAGLHVSAAGGCAP
jgi:hypothetical protein